MRLIGTAAALFALTGLVFALREALGRRSRWLRVPGFVLYCACAGAVVGGVVTLALAAGPLVLLVLGVALAVRLAWPHRWYLLGVLK